MIEALGVPSIQAIENKKVHSVLRVQNPTWGVFYQIGRELGQTCCAGKGLRTALSLSEGGSRL
jgi:hypothetical protein